MNNDTFTRDGAKDQAVIGASKTSPLVSVVVIGRNEGERLRRCLLSVDAADWGDVAYETIYVDSRSSDGSVAMAQSLGATSLVLDDTSPCAAKARNLGWQRARGEFILFLDGDTELAAGFVRSALHALDDASVCAAWGHRRESDPKQSVYTRVLDLDWLYPAGRTLYFGGDVLVRRQALADVQGFDPTLKAGEEPELCARLRARGWQIEHLDEPMTRHDLGVRSFRAYALRCYRSGIAYAEVADRMRQMGDRLWQREATRDLVHGALYALFPILAMLAFAWDASAGLALLCTAALVILRSAWRCRWRAPGDVGLCLQYAVHSHIQKLPAFAGQMAWRRARRQHRDIGLVEYKDGGASTGSASKRLLARMLMPFALARRVIGERWARLWSFAKLQEGLGQRLDASNVILGEVELHGTRNISFGRGVLLYPGVYLETQGAGRIEIGDRVVLSRGVHVVAHAHVVLGDGCMVGEYSSLRDANHRASVRSMRDSGHDSAPIRVGANVWIGRGVTVLKGTRIGAHSIVGANAVVTRDLPEHSRAAGVPARLL